LPAALDVRYALGMPELPEVEATRQNLQRWSEGLRIKRVERVDDSLEPALDSLVGAAFGSWERRGKALAGVTDRGVLFSHLGMTGRWVVDPEDDRRFVRLAIDLAHGRKVRRIAYLDARRLGDAKVVASVDAAFAKLGPDAWLTPLTATQLQAAMGKGDKATLKERLLEQKRYAGLGNIAVIEACFRAKVHPRTPISAVTPAVWKRLVPAIHDHLAATLAGTVGPPEIIYVSEGGENIFAVYGRKDEPCPHCGTSIAREVFAGRPTYFCPKCQPEPL